MQTVYEYITTEETAYQTVFIPVVEGYEWNMFDHVKTTTLYLNSVRKNGKKGEDLPFRNIILPKINLEHRAVQFNLSEIEFYINSEGEDYKAFLLRKWHERWALQNNISDKLDRMSESYTDYGGVLLEDTPEGWDVVPFQRLAFVDQTDMMSGPICQKHQYSPDQLKEMEKRGWKDIDRVITLAQDEKSNSQSAGGKDGKKVQTPGRYIEVYDLEGMLPESFLTPDGDKNTFVRQLQVVTFYTDANGTKNGITLFSGKKTKERYKAFKRDEIYGRALGRGAVEELFEPQVWVNYTEIQKMDLLDQVSKIIYQTADKSFKARNTTSDMKSGDVLTYTEGMPLTQLNTGAINLQAFENASAMWDNQAMQIASAQPAISGDENKSGMPFRLGALLNQEAHSLHQYRKERLGNFLSSEVYPDWVIPKMMKDVAAGAEFLSCLSIDEMGEIVDQVVAYHFNKSVIAKVLKGEIVWPEDAQGMQDTYRQQFFKTNRKFLKLLEGDLKGLPVEAEVNITGEQKNRLMMIEKTSQIWTQASNVLMADPNFFTNHPEMAKSFNEIVEGSGLSAMNFGMSKHIQPVQPQPLTPQSNAPSQPQAAPVPAQPASGGY